MIKVGEVERDTDEGTHSANSRSLTKTSQLLLLNGFNQEGNHHEEDDEEVIISHLHVVGIHLESREDGCQEQAFQILAAISQHHSRNHRRQISQCPYLPDMTGCDNDKEVGRECPDDTTQRRQRLSEIESTQHDVEAKKIYEYIPYIIWQPQVISLSYLVEHLGTAIRRRHLISWHSAEYRVGPASSLASLLLVKFLLMSQSLACRRVVTEQDSSVHVGRHEVGEGDYRKNNYYQNIQ